MTEAHISVSFVVPVRGDAEDLSQFLEIGESLTRYEGSIEWILAVDGPTGPRAPISEVLRGLTGTKGVKIVKPAGHGPGAARNAGLEASSGDYVAFLDADDAAELGGYVHLAHLLKVRGLNVGALGYCIDDERPEGRLLEEAVPRPGVQAGWTLIRRRAAVWRFVFQREFCLRNALQFPDLTFGEDLCFLAQALLSDERVLGLPQICYRYRLHSSGQLSQGPVSAEQSVAVLAELETLLVKSQTRSQRRLLESWVARVSIRGRSFTAGRLQLLRGMLWSIVWLVVGPGNLSSYFRVRRARRAAV